MDFRNISRSPRIFPKRKFPAVLNRDYRKLDFSSTLVSSLPQKHIERRDHHDVKRFEPVHDINNLKEVIINRNQQKSSPVPFTVLQTSDEESQQDSPHTVHVKFRSNYVEPIIDSLIIKTIATVHTEPTES